MIGQRHSSCRKGRNFDGNVLQTKAKSFVRGRQQANLQVCLWGAEKLKLSSVRLKVILLSFWTLFVCGCAQAEGKSWKLYHVSNEEFHFYDVKSITRHKGVVKVSEKSVLRQTKPCNLTEALKEVVELEKKSSGEMSGELRKKTVNNLALQETRRLYEMRCSKRMYRMITGMEYDKEGTLIDGIISSIWEGIKPDSIIEKLFETICH